MIRSCTNIRKISGEKEGCFNLYKRLFLDIKTREENIAASREIYELPIPQDEIEFGDNNN